MQTEIFFGSGSEFYYLIAIERYVTTSNKQYADMLDVPAKPRNEE